MTGPVERQFAPATVRNTQPILTVLRAVLPRRGRVLEIGSGTGQHVVAFAAAFPAVDWQPSDPDPEARRSIAAWAADSGSDNVSAPLDIDVTARGWETVPTRPLDAILCINLLHIAAWEVCEGLIRGAARLLTPARPLILYGPFTRGGAHTAPSNAQFDRALRWHNPAWGVRDLDEVTELAGTRGFALNRVVDMPANNLSVVFRPQP